MGAKVTRKQDRRSGVEVRILLFPRFLASADFALTEMFAIANRYASSHGSGSLIRVSHWETSQRKPDRSSESLTVILELRLPSIDL